VISRENRGVLFRRALITTASLSRKHERSSQNYHRQIMSYQETSSNADDASNATVRIALKELKPLAHVNTFAQICSLAEPSGQDLTAMVHTGRQPYPVVVYDMRILFGLKLISVLKAAGIETVETVQCKGCEGLHESELLLKAVGLHRRADRKRRHPESFAELLLGAELYHVWIRTRIARSPRRRSIQQRMDCEARREQLIREEFGRSRRSLERAANLLALVPALLDAARCGLLPIRDAEAALRLSGEEQIALAELLRQGVPFKTAKKSFMVDDGRKRTVRGAHLSICRAIRQIVTEGNGREDAIGLQAGDRDVAAQAVNLLTGWLRTPPPLSAAAQIQEFRASLWAGPQSPDGAADATGGVQGAAGGCQ